MMSGGRIERADTYENLLKSGFNISSHLEHNEDEDEEKETTGNKKRKLLRRFVRANVLVCVCACVVCSCAKDIGKNANHEIQCLSAREIS